MAFHKFFRALLKGEELPLYGTGEQTRDFTYVGDAVAANLAAAERGEPGGVYNIGGGSRVSLKEVFRVMEKVTGIAPRLRSLPMQPGDVLHTGADVSRAKRDLGYNPATSLEQGLAAEFEYVKELMREGL